MDKLIDEYLIAVNVDRSETDAHKALIAQHLQAFARFADRKEKTDAAAQE